MTEIVYDRTRMEITVHGHARAGKEGEDLVCAGVSTLVWTIIEALKKGENSGCVKLLSWSYERGDAFVRLRPAAGMKNVVTMMLEALLSGAEWLSKEYPDHVSYKKII